MQVFGSRLERAIVEIQVQGVKSRIDTLHRAGGRAPLVFLHGFGSTKEDYADAALHPVLADYRILAFDAPGFGGSTCSDASALSMEYLVAVVEAVCDHFEIGPFHLCGHSMGGLAAVLLAHTRPVQILSLVNIEGNLVSEDCFLSRQILESGEGDSAAFLDRLRERIWRVPQAGFPLYAAGLTGKTAGDAVRPILRSMVFHSDHSSLMEKFLSIPCPKMFMHGEQNRGLPYLGQLRAGGVAVAEISHAGHFPMYSNPQETLSRMAEFLDQIDRTDGGTS